MKKLLILFCAGVLMSALCAVVVSCELQEENVPFEIFTFGEGSSARWVHKVDYVDKVLVINSDEELKKYVEGEYHPVDFTKHTLLLTTGSRATNGIDKIDTKLTRNGDEYLLSIFVKLNMTAVAQGWFLPLITPKLSKHKQVKLNIKYQEPGTSETEY